MNTQRNSQARDGIFKIRLYCAQASSSVSRQMTCGLTLDFDAALFLARRSADFFDMGRQRPARICRVGAARATYENDVRVIGRVAIPAGDEPAHHNDGAVHRLRCNISSVRLPPFTLKFSSSSDHSRCMMVVNSDAICTLSLMGSSPNMRNSLYNQ